MPEAPPQPFADEQEKLEAVREEIARVVVGQTHIVDRLLIALLCGGHVLIEGVPGLAKTLLVSTLAKTLDTSFNRIQFTPDLLPGDLVGTLVFNPKSGDFHTQKGPVFANVILADEINRSPAKVQSALLEAMQERQVSIGDETYALDEPFIVLATQNPIEQEGTYPLPEAQLDRFLFKVLVTYPNLDEEQEIMRRMSKNRPDLTVRPAITGEEILEIRKSLDAVYMKDLLETYILRLVDATRHPENYELDDLAPLIRHGASPRASIYLAKASKARALMEGRDYVVPADVQSIAPEVLRHRIALTYKAQAQDVTSDQVIESIFLKLPHSVLIPETQFHDLDIRCRQAVEELLAGEYLSVFKGRGIEFDDVRPYQAGDEVRSIDWKVTARTGEPYVKRFVEERDLTVYLLVDVSASGRFGSRHHTKIEAAAELAGMLAHAAVRAHDRVGLILFTDTVERHLPPGKGLVHVSQLLYEVLHHEPRSRETDLNAPLDYLLHLAKRRCVAFLISDFQAQNYSDALQAAGAAHDLIAVTVVDPREARLPAQAGLIQIQDSETGRRRLVDASSRQARAAFAEAADEQRRELWDRLERSQVDHFDLTVGADYTAELRAFLRGRLQKR